MSDPKPEEEEDDELVGLANSAGAEVFVPINPEDLILSNPICFPAGTRLADIAEVLSKAFDDD